MKNQIKLKENKKNWPAEKKNNLEKATIEFISQGIACHALCLLENSGILKTLLLTGKYKDNLIEKFKNSALLKSAFVSLVGAKVLYFRNNSYCLTNLGISLAKKIGLITMPLVGYGKLFYNQFRLLNNPESFHYSDIDFANVAISSIDFGKDDLDPLLFDIFKKINTKGTICDLGCGTGEKLIKICQLTNSPGLGIEQNVEVIKQSKKYLKNYSNIEIIQNSITTLEGIWEDVTIGMISFVLHDINCEQECINILHSYQSHFPRMQYLVVIDIVSPSEKTPTIMPGFDYVHGLQGILPRNYEETIKVFNNANYNISKEISVPNLPNTFIWILEPFRNLSNGKESRCK